MNPIFGWTLALVGVIAGSTLYGWQGLVLALTIITFSLVLQFGQVMRAMRQAATQPVGYVDSAVMLHAKLQPGMRMLDVVRLTRSLGQRTDEHGEVYAWGDPGGSHVRATFGGGRLRTWDLQRASGDAPR